MPETKTEKKPEQDPAQGEKPKKKIDRSAVWAEARALIWQRRGRIGLGLVFIFIGRLAGLVLPASAKFLIDDVVGQGQADLLMPLAGAVGIATLIQAFSSFALTMLLGIAAQRSITDLRKQVQQHITRLPVSYFDSVKSGELISRVMTDAEGVRNLVGSGLVQLIGGLFTASLAMAALLYLNWRLTLAVLAVMLLFMGGMAVFFKRLRPIFRERGKINAEVTGRLGETLGGVRLIKAYTAEKREDLVFARGAHKLLRNVVSSMTGVATVTAFSSPGWWWGRSAS